MKLLETNKSQYFETFEKLPFDITLLTGLTLATENDTDAILGRPVYISALQEDGLAERTKTIHVSMAPIINVIYIIRLVVYNLVICKSDTFKQVNDQLLEVDGKNVTSMSLDEIISLLQANSGDVIRLKLARLISIPERDFSCTLRRSSKSGSERLSTDDDSYQTSCGGRAIYLSRPPIPSASPCRSTPSSISSSIKSCGIPVTNYE